MKHEFKIGDRVQVDTTEYATASRSHDPFKDTGTVISIDFSRSLPYAVEMDHSHRSECHTCGGQTKDNHGYWCDETMISLLARPSLDMAPRVRINILKMLSQNKLKKTQKAIK